jgi:PAS domain S-box-containing protein
MNIVASQPQPAPWLATNGPRELELLFRAIVYHPSAPILITDNDRNYLDASAGASKLLGLPREKIIGHRLDDFAPPAFKPQVSQLWRAFLDQGEQEGVLKLVGPDGALRDVEYKAKLNILPIRHVLVLRDKTASPDAEPASTDPIPSWVQELRALFTRCRRTHRHLVFGAARIYNYPAEEAIGQHVAFLYPGRGCSPGPADGRAQADCNRRPHGNRGWQTRKDGSRFWANTITMALKDGHGELQRFCEGSPRFYRPSR